MSPWIGTPMVEISREKWSAAQLRLNICFYVESSAKLV
jgi:hypothetical protein